MAGLRLGHHSLAYEVQCCLSEFSLGHELPATLNRTAFPSSFAASWKNRFKETSEVLDVLKPAEGAWSLVVAQRKAKARAKRLASPVTATASTIPSQSVLVTFECFVSPLYGHYVFPPETHSNA